MQLTNRHTSVIIKLIIRIVDFVHPFGSKSKTNKVILIIEDVPS